MDAKLQRRVQRYGWDLASNDYDSSGRNSSRRRGTGMLDLAALAPGENVLDLACGTGIATLDAALPSDPAVLCSARICPARWSKSRSQRAAEQQLSNVTFARMDAETLDFPDCDVRRRVVLAGLDVRARRADAHCASGYASSSPAAASPSRSGASASTAAGRRCFRSSKRKSTATSARCSSRWASPTCCRACARTRGSTPFASDASRPC